MEYYWLFWLLLAVLLVSAATALYQVSPRAKRRRQRRREERERRRVGREMAEKLRQGDLTPALRYFWSVGDYERIGKFLRSRSEMPLLSEGVWGELWSASPNFRRIVNTTYDNAVRLRAVLDNPNNVFLAEELRQQAEEVITFCVADLWQTCHRLFFLARSGADKKQMKPALQKLAAELETHAQILAEAAGTVNSFIAQSGSITGLDAAKSVLQKLCRQARDVRETADDVRAELRSLPPQGVWGDIPAAPRRTREKEAVPRGREDSSGVNEGGG